MRRWLTAIALTFAVAFALVGCGKSGSTAANSGTSGGSNGAAATNAAATCPTSAQKTLVKTRFAADLGAIVFSTKHWLITPYQEGKLSKGHSGRLLAILKAGAAGLAIYKATENAISNAKADPTLCNVLIQPLTDLSNALSGLKSKLMGGDLSGIQNLDGTVSSLESGAKGQLGNLAQSALPGLP